MSVLGLISILVHLKILWKFNANYISCIPQQVWLNKLTREHPRLLKIKITTFNLLIWFGLCWEMGIHKGIYHCADGALKAGLDICHFFLSIQIKHLIVFYVRQHFPFNFAESVSLFFINNMQKTGLYLTWLTPSRHRTASYFLSHPCMNSIVPYSLLYLLIGELVCWQILDKLCWVSHRSFPY